MVKLNKFRESIHYYKNANVPSLGTGKWPHEVDEQFLHGPSTGAGRMQTNTGVFRRLGSLTSVTVAHVSKDLTLHAWPPEASSQLPKGLVGPQMTRKNTIMKVF
jgi:hypothetical protein